MMPTHGNDFRLENLSILEKLEVNMERLNLNLFVILQFIRVSSEGRLCRTIGALGWSVPRTGNDFNITL